jgi:3'-5' exoribonuclease
MIKNLKAGEKITEKFIVNVMKIGSSSNGGVFARGEVKDNSGGLPFICFDANEVEFLREAKTSMALLIKGVVDINKVAKDNSLQIIVKNFELLPEDADLTDLLPVSDIDLELYKTKLKVLMASVKDIGISKLLNNILSGKRLEQFLTHPAGTSMHHGYIGGLLHHSVCVAELALAMAEKIGDVNKDLVVTGALLHDIGKLREISGTVGYPYTDDGKMLGHISMSAILVNNESEKIPEITEENKRNLVHIILAHHGDREKGSPMVCVTKESFIVHYADEINAVMNQFEGAELKPGWNYNRMLKRNLYI